MSARAVPGLRAPTQAEYLAARMIEDDRERRRRRPNGPSIRHFSWEEIMGEATYSSRVATSMAERERAK